MQWFKPNKMLAIYAICNVVLMLLVILELGWTSVAALFVTYLFMSIMFPTIFALGIRGLGEKTKLASSFLVMAVAGGAVCPMFMGWIADHHGMAVGLGSLGLFCSYCFIRIIRIQVSEIKFDIVQGEF